MYQQQNYQPYPQQNQYIPQQPQFHFEWDLNNINRGNFVLKGNRIEYTAVNKTMTAVSKTIFDGNNTYEFDVTYYVVRDGFFTFGVAKLDYSNWTQYCHKEQGLGMIGTYMGGGTHQIINLKGRLDMSAKKLHLSRNVSYKTESVEYDFTSLMSYNGVRLAVSFSDASDYLELNNFRVTNPQQQYNPQQFNQTPQYSPINQFNPQQGQLPPPQYNQQTPLYYPQDQNQYNPQQGQFPPQQQFNPQIPQTQYNPQQGQLPPQQGQFPPQQQFNQQTPLYYPQDQNQYNPQQGQLPPQQGQFPPQQYNQQTPQYYPPQQQLNPLYFAWEVNNSNRSVFHIDNNNCNARYVANDTTTTIVSQTIFYDNVNEFDLSYFCAKGTHFTLGVVSSNFSDWKSYCHKGNGIGMIGTYFGCGDRTREQIKVIIDMSKKELTLKRKTTGQGAVYKFAHLSSNGVRLACSLTYKDDCVSIDNSVIQPHPPRFQNFPPLQYFQWETNNVNSHLFRSSGKRVDYLGRDKTTTCASNTINSDCEFDATYYCSRDGFFTFGVAKPSYSNWTQYCHKDQGVGMIGTYMGGGVFQRIDLRVKIDINSRELTITRKSNGESVIYSFGSLYSNGIKLAVSFSDIGDYIEIN
eukprot:TRINITY_DN269_c0_g1_i1.p1 TRINITY_DN269_c0_g1~~TRINITY_DN269_c0_g1_i1.p1  ORF type:complete len:632 (-),score=188.74 TRINITY_DN269_c0_g1_i1:52-1947(-)